MKYLIILVLFITSCTDKKQTAEPVVVEPITPKAPSSPKITKLSYDKGLDLMLVDTFFKQWHSEVVGYEKANQEEKGNWGRYYGYYAMYWDTNTQTYYGVTNNYDWYHGTPITNMQFEYTIDETKQYEAIFYPTMKEIFTNTGASLLYIGSISPLERVYLDPTNQIYYIKYLAPWDTSLYIIENDNNTTTTYQDIYTNDSSITTNSYTLDNMDGITSTNTNTLPIFPCYKPSINVYYSQEIETDVFITNDDNPNINYTNSDGNKFFGIDPLDSMRKIN